jgi:hypothetical protein
MAALLMYSLVYVERRFLGAFLVLLFIGAYQGPYFARWGVRRGTGLAVAGLVGLSVVVPGLMGLPRALYRTLRGLSTAQFHTDHSHLHAAEMLSTLGLQQGDKIAAIGFCFDAYYAHFAGLRIVAQVPDEEAQTYWQLKAEGRRLVLQKLAETGAKGVVTKRVPECEEGNSWRRLGGSGYYYASLLQSDGPLKPAGDGLARH